MQDEDTKQLIEEMAVDFFEYFDKFNEEMGNRSNVEKCLITFGCLMPVIINSLHENFSERISKDLVMGLFENSWADLEKYQRREREES